MIGARILSTLRAISKIRRRKWLENSSTSFSISRACGRSSPNLYRMKRGCKAGRRTSSSSAKSSRPLSAFLSANKALTRFCRSTCATNSSWRCSDHTQQILLAQQSKMHTQCERVLQVAIAYTRKKTTRAGKMTRFEAHYQGNLEWASICSARTLKPVRSYFAMVMLTVHLARLYLPEESVHQKASF